MCVNLLSLAECALNQTSLNPVTFYQGETINKDVFCKAVTNKTQQLLKQSQQAYGLYYEESYPFSVMLFALLHAGKEIWLAANNKQSTAEKLIQQKCSLLGDWQGQESSINESIESDYGLSKLDLKTAKVIIFTSGSSGQPKAITKYLWQFQHEIEVLEKQWGAKLGHAQALATVSHQHIYGLLFKVLWPLASGRCFHSAMYLSPEPLLKAMGDQPAYWVSSPTQQKRLDELTPWEKIQKLSTIFSSGGILTPDIAKNIHQHSRQNVIEVYGSSETGGVAWRESMIEPHWTVFNGVSIEQTTNKQCLIKSDFLPDTDQFFLDDKIEFHQDGLFSLVGRMDRIVKVEGKRLSLNEMELVLSRFDWVNTAHCFLYTSKREGIVAAIALTVSGLNYFNKHGRNVIVKKLRSQLMQSFETVTIPRKWLLINELPLTTQGKINHSLISDLVCLDKKKFPQLHYSNYQANTVELSLRIQAELVYFEGHFPDQPILPGIAQLSWVEHYGKLFFGIDQPFLRMEVIKFKKIIQPNHFITIHLTWNADNGKLYFDLHSKTEKHSSGRMIYGKIN